MPAPHRTKRKRNSKAAASTHNDRTGSDPASPTYCQWEQMTQYGAFVVRDALDRDVRFKLGDTAAILPGGTPPGTEIPEHEYWIGKIIAIRERGVPVKSKKNLKKKKGVIESQQATRPDVWVKVKWFYSPVEVAGKIENFSSNHCSIFERIYSDHSEVFKLINDLAPVSVKRFREDDADQEPIYDEEFFARYFLQASSKPAQLYSYFLQTSGTHLSNPSGCICKTPYDVENHHSLCNMYMCPRPRCRRFYHTACLLEYGYWTPMDHPLIRLRSSPDTDTIVSGPSPRKGSSLGCRTPTRAVSLPDNLIRLAAQPIVRGAALPALGITGNCHDVVRARRFVYAALLKSVPVPPDWDAEIDFDAAIVDEVLPVLEAEETGEALVFMCPGCGGPI
ncbi:hypothetical protein C8R43DRAFT_979432 [Mycena crocata]|nr:hypothetical protein C8R43DRAFT_979432 [Mycena crocata]